MTDQPLEYNLLTICPSRFTDDDTGIQMGCWLPKGHELPHRMVIEFKWDDDGTEWEDD